MSNTYKHYYKYPYEKFVSYYKICFKEFGFSLNLFNHLMDFSKNKEINKIHRNTIINQLIKLEEKDPDTFLDEGLDILSELYNYESHTNLLLKEFDENLETAAYKNIFTNRGILFNNDDSKPLQCGKVENKHIYSDISLMSLINFSIPNIEKMCSILGLTNSDDEYKYFIKFALLHEMAHDTDYQNYLIYKDYSMGIPLTPKTNHIAEQDSDLLALLMVIQSHSLYYSEAISLIFKILQFRSSINEFKAIDSNIKGLKDDSNYIHLTEPAILILLGLIERNDVFFIHNLSVKEMIKLSYKIIKEANNKDYKINCINYLQEPNKDMFLYNLTLDKFNIIFKYYLISMHGDEDFKNYSILDESEKFIYFHKFKENFIKKIYDEELLEYNINFRLKLSFEYAYLSNNDYQDLINSYYFQSILDKIKI